MMGYDYRYVKQSGGHGQYGHVNFNLEPLESGAGLQFENKIRGGAIPRSLSRDRKRFRRSRERTLAGFPMTDMKFTLVDGSFHEVDSSDMAFRMATIFGIREAAEKAEPVILEPIMQVEITIPEEYTGDIIGQINMRVGNVVGMDDRFGNAKAIHAEVPLSEMFGYATELRSATQGRGVFTMEFKHYDRVSDAYMKKILGRL